jgi:hypothetical protein
MADNNYAPLISKLIQVFQSIPEAIKKAAEIGGGSIMKGNLREAQDLIPDIVRVDTISFLASIGNAGVAAQAAQVRVNPDYDFQLTGITGYYEIPDDALPQDTQDIARTTFQMREAGRSSDVFTTPLPMAAIVGAAGPVSPLDWGVHGTYLFRAGAEIQPTFAVTAAHTHAARVWGVTLIGVLIRKR